MFSFKNLVDSKDRALVMGVLNITPDSFSDGGEAITVSQALEKLKCLCEQGADIIDVGACSTAPMNMLASEEAELSRLKRLLPEIVKNSTVPVSVDTFRPSVAQYALSEGVSIINDESGIYNIGMAECVKAYGAGWIFMHTGGGSSATEEKYLQGVVNDVLSFFAEMKRKALYDGISEDQLCFDCGIGFGKTRQDDLELLSSCKELSRFSPLLIGASRKRVIGEIVGGKEPKDRLWGSVAVATIAACNGAGILRVHDVKETADALKVAAAVKRGVL